MSHELFGATRSVGGGGGSSDHQHPNLPILNATTAPFTAADRTVIDGLDGQLAGKADANHSHTLSDVSDAGSVASYSLEQLQDAIAAMLQSGSHTNLSVNYDDDAGTISLSAAGGGSGGGIDQEQAEDIVAALIDVTGSGINVAYDDAGGSLTISLTGESYTTTEKNKLAGIAAAATVNSTDADLRDRATHTGVQAISTVSGLQTELDAKAELADITDASTKATPVDADSVSLVDSEDSSSLKRLSWSNLKTAIKTWLVGFSNTWAAPQISSVGTITEAASITLDASAVPIRNTLTMTGAVTLAISNLVEGQQIDILVIQDSTGGRSLTWSGVAGTEPSQQTAADGWTLYAIRKINGINTFVGGLSS